MDAKDLRIESALGAHNDDGKTKYAQSGTAFQTNIKPYHDIASHTLSKVDVQTARPCAIIGPDRVVPPQSTNDSYVKKIPVDPWPCTDSIYQHPPEFVHKPAEYQLPRNISPRQTFQENMQRIMVPPSYTSVKNSEDHCLKNPKLMSLDSKFCDVPYTISPINNESKIVKNPEGHVLNNNSNQLPHGWASNGVNVRPLRQYGAPDVYQYSEFSNCPAPRPVSMIRPHRNVHEDVPQVYQDRYHEANIRFKPYPTTKERPLQNPHLRYDYIPNYPNVFQPHAAYPHHKYELQKSVPTHPYSIYPPVPLKYLERRIPVPTMEKYPRSPSQSVNFNQSICNQNIPSSFGTLPGNFLQNRAYPYAPDPSAKNMIPNRLYFDSNNSRKYYPNSENLFVNDINRPSTLKTDLIYPSYPPINIHSLPPHHMYRKESPMKGYEHSIHYRNIEYSTNVNPMGRLPLQFPSHTMSISPSDSIASNDTTQILGNTPDDCGYASQSSTASMRSIESGVNRISNDIYRRPDMTIPHTNKFGQKLDTSTSSKDKKDLDVRQFLQMWNEGDDEGNDNNKEIIKHRDTGNSLGHYDSGNSQEQLYVLGLVNVPKEELGKYEHIQKISKLPENIKGYNSIELLNQYEKLVESPNLNHVSSSPLQPKQKDLHGSIRHNFSRHGLEASSATARPLSPLDVEAKISQSVIHKEVGCNFEIRPCSPQMMNVELATPVHNVLGERLIEKVVNPVQTKSSICQRVEETSKISALRSSPKVPSCKMVNNQYTSPHLNDSLKPNYCLQDFEGNSGVCLASLPRLDNDIELNFPEINQQFINDNKISSIRDLPILDTDNGVNAQKSKLHSQPFITEHLNPSVDSDKDVSKLSKYRKQKRNSVPNENDDTLSMAIHRTDSVIIKNPDNARSQEEFINDVSLINNNTTSAVDIVKPMNIVGDNDKVINYSDKKSPGKIHKNYKDYKSLDNDTAIDFSLSKCDDVQSNTINSLDLSLNDALKNNIETDKSVYLNNDTINYRNDAPCSQNLSRQLEDIVASDNMSVVLPKSPTLSNTACSRVLNNDAILQCVNDDNLDFNTHETVITHSKSNEIISEISLGNISALTDEIISHNDLPSLSHDNENVYTDISGSINNESENVSKVSNGAENKALNYCLAEHPNEVATPICELKCYSKVYVDKGGEDKTSLQQNENSTSNEEGITESNKPLHSGTKDNNTPQDIAIAEFENEITHNVLIDSESNKNLSNDEISNPKKILEDEIFEIKGNYIEITDKCDNENYGAQEISIVNNVGQNNPPNSNDIMLFNSTNIPCKEINNDLSSETKTNNITSSIANETETLNPLLERNVGSKSIECDTESYQAKYKSAFNKELFSPCIQNLFIYFEGPCTSVTKRANEYTKEDSDYHHKSFRLQSIKDTAMGSVEPYFEHKTTGLEFDINKHINNDVSDNSVDVVENSIRNENDKLCNVDMNIIIDKVQQNDMDDIKDEIHTKKSAMGNCCSDRIETLIEVAKDSDDTISENKTDNNNKINNHIEEKNPLRFMWNQLPNKRNRTLKRSLSESAVTEYTAAAVDIQENVENNFINSRKRAKIDESEIFVESQMLTENVTSFIQNNRRNSVSTIYNDENVSFCIFIDNDCILTEENESCQKICYTEIPEECLTTVCTEENALNSELPGDISYEDTTEVCGEEETLNSELTADVYYEDNSDICGNQGNINSESNSENVSYDDPQPFESEVTFQNLEARTIEETWVEDVACMETIFSDDIGEDIIISAPSSPKESESSENEISHSNFMYNITENEHTNKVKHIYGNRMCDDDAELVEKLYRTPQMNVNKTLIDRESQLLQEYNRYYDNESLEKILSEANNLQVTEAVLDKSLSLPSTITSGFVHRNKENLQNLFPDQDSKNEIYSGVELPDLGHNKLSEEQKEKEYNECPVHSCESSCDNLLTYKREEKLQYAISSSPEVSSTTSEEKGPAILLKIRNYKGSKISEVNEMSASFNHTHSQRPLITKAAQKYIPPLKETIHDLKVKIRLPKQSLYKLQQLKKSKEKPKIDTNCSKLYNKSLAQASPKKAKPKPKFEDVLMSIDELQFKKHKTKNKKNKQSVPKVIIKKNENGAHYASTQSKDTFNPDLTGRKWQPWVFLEKSNFVDKMALKQKFKAIYSHRKKTFVLAESFRKYKSISNAKFVMTVPNINDNISTGNLKYTFRLKHS